MKPNTTYAIYGIGNALLDKVYHVDTEFLAAQGIEKGLMTLVDEANIKSLLQALKDNLCVKESSGGSVANSIIAASHFGANNFLSVCLADDKNGQTYYNDMQEAKVSSNYDTTSRGPGFTGVCVVEVTDDADRTMSSYLGISETLSPKELNVEALKQSTYFFIEGYLVTSPSARKAVLEGLDIAHQHGVKTALTLSDPFIVKNFREYMNLFIGKGVDLLFCNEEEAMHLCESDLTHAKEKLKTVAKQFVITCGQEGALLYDGSDFIKMPSRPVKGIDTNGAGDMYAGSFLYGITHGLSFHDAGVLASDAADKVVSQYGPRLTKEDALAVLKAFQNRS